MKVILGSDHNGYEVKEELKRYLNSLNYEIEDMGCENAEKNDYPIYAKNVCEEVLKSSDSLGILICGTGIGMSIAANKFKKIRCAKIDNEEEAKLCRMHNNANVIALSSKKDIELIKKEVYLFLNTPFSNEERHIRRIEEIESF